MVGVTASALMGVLEPLLGNLSSMLSQEFDKIKNVHNQIEFLRDELLSMSATLETMSEPEEQNPQAQVWMGQLRDLSYDIEDRIETFMFLGQDNTSDGFIKKVINVITGLKKRYDIGNQISELKDRALEISDRRKRYRLDPSVSCPKSVVIDPRLPGLFEESEKLVGIDVQRDKIVNLLTDCTDGHMRKVLSIVGSGGLGKTTLANQVLHKIKIRFDCTAFVSVSRECNVEKVLTDVLLQFSKTESLFTANQNEDNERMHEDLRMRRLEYPQLMEMSRNYLKNKRYLVIIDDIWDTQAWNEIQCAFPQNRLGSRIMTTTRNDDVATFCSFANPDLVYSMKQLDANDSQKLFLARIFKHEDDLPQDMKKVTTEILKKCGGLPLAIVSIASLLASKPTSRQQWERVRDSISSAVEKRPELENIKKILFMSYYQLPHQLKTCFLYLSQFPEDYEIDRSILIRRWIAEGFIAEQRGQSLQDIAENNFNELVNRNMIQPVHIDYNGVPAACRVHDIMLDLIISLAAQENFSTVMNSVKATPLPNIIRRLSLQGNFWQGGNVSSIRSLTVFEPAKRLPPVSEFQVLRVLDIEGPSAQDSGYIEGIGNLIHLRYLRIKDSRISRFEGHVGRLRFLKTLDLEYTLIEQLPTEVTQLNQLVHLFVSHTTKLPKGIGRMVALEELSMLNAIINSPDVLQELEKLEKLKVLNIRWNSADANIDQETIKQSLVNSFCKLGENNLQYLYIQSMDFFCMNFMLNSWCPPPKHMRRFTMDAVVPFFEKVPSWVFTMSQLQSLQIWVETLTAEDVHLLQELHCLTYLNLETTQSLQETVSIRCGGFQRLKVLLFCCMNLSGGLGLKFEAGAAPRIEEIVLSFAAHEVICSNGDGFDTGISHLSTLKGLSVKIYCQQATTRELEVVESAIRSTAALLPKNPVLYIGRRREDEMVNRDGQMEGAGVSENN
ncbi:unnamed protein product [Urochloa decumbens]|uniref:Uncharacterized protein n=1 Tax=Urochloa decumbens TaxID=240449 RepID=A0ABC9C0E8_9POAL